MANVTPEQEVTNWLKSIKLERYTDLFLEAGFDDLEVLAHLTDEDLDSLETKIPIGHKKKILLKARDLGSATLRGYYSNGVYTPPPKSLITSAQLAEIKAQEQLAKAKLKASPFSPKQQEEMRLALKAEVLRDLKSEGFEVDESLKKATADLTLVRSTPDDEEGDDVSVSMSTASESTATASSSSKVSKRGKKLKRKKNLAAKKAAAAAAAAGNTKSPRKHKATRSPRAPHTRRRTRSNERIATAAKNAGSNGKPVPVKVYLPQRPDEPLIFSLYATNTVHDLVGLAARSLDVPASEFSLQQVDPTGQSSRVDPGVKPLQLISSFGADASLYRFELAARSKSFVRFYHENDSSKFYTIEIDGETEAGDVVEKIALQTKAAEDSIVVMCKQNDRKRVLAEYEFVRNVIDQSKARGHETTFTVCDRASINAALESNPPLNSMGSSHSLVFDPHADDERSASTPNKLPMSPGLGLGRAGAESPLSPKSGDGVVRGPFWNVMQGSLSSGSSQTIVNVQNDDVTESWSVNTKKSLREQLASLAAKFHIPDIHNYDIFRSDSPKQALNINVPVSLDGETTLILRHRNPAKAKAAKAARAARQQQEVAANQPPPPPSSSSSHKPKHIPPPPTSAPSSSKHAPPPPSSNAPTRRRNKKEAIESSSDSSSSEALPAPPLNVSKATKSILKSRDVGGAESDVTDVTSDDSKSDRKVSFGRQFVHE